MPYDVLLGAGNLEPVEHHGSLTYLAESVIEPVVFGWIGPVVYPAQDECIVGLLLDI